MCRRLPRRRFRRAPSRPRPPTGSTQVRVPSRPVRSPRPSLVPRPAHSSAAVRVRLARRLRWPRPLRRLRPPRLLRTLRLLPGSPSPARRWRRVRVRRAACPVRPVPRGSATTRSGSAAPLRPPARRAVSPARPGHRPVARVVLPVSVPHVPAAHRARPRVPVPVVRVRVLPAVHVPAWVLVPVPVVPTARPVLPVPAVAATAAVPAVAPEVRVPAAGSVPVRPVVVVAVAMPPALSVARAARFGGVRSPRSSAARNSTTCRPRRSAV